MSSFSPITGRIIQITQLEASARSQTNCTLLISILTSDFQTINLTVAPTTYIYNQTQLKIGDAITAFYDTMAPVPMIYPPQYRPVAIVPAIHGENIVLDYFNTELVSSDGRLRLTPGASTNIVMTNGQTYHRDPANHYLLVFYGASTRSIPAITTPSKIVVFCFMA